MYQGYSTLRVDRSAATAWLTLDHPPINLLDAAMITDLDRVGQELAADNSVRVVVLRSAIAGFFVAHADLELILEAGAVPEIAKQTIEAFHAAVDRFRTMPKVTIAQIEGRCRGGGSEIALACDMRFAARETAMLAQLEVALGLVPGGGASTRLPRLVGRGRALEIILGCADFDADLAERYGWVNRSISANSIADFVARLAARIARYPAEAISLAKSAVIAQEPDVEDGLAAERECFLRAAASESARQLMSAAVSAGLQTVSGETAERDRA
jgi:enoyl-CoA hydratase/carnithine racemase